MADWASMTDKELAAFCADSAKVEAETNSQRDKLQIEWCKRNRAKYVREDGSVGYELPDWIGD